MDNLTRDCIAARMADMTYGKWKAAQQKSESPEPLEIDPDKMRKCKNCGALFAKGKHYRAYCSGECREKYEKIHKREYMRENRYRAD